ncbi:hypothetical protein [Flavobacterium sp. N502540]|uniref:hypothetical protein n=1 Tax=Flavobacterium sp. N502540 TaxID=2986838 RepID=UPI0022259648|nr:hypothetical protein [Flavobacterium sp. N502540]
MKLFIVKYSVAIISCLYLAYFFYNSERAGSMIKTGTALVLALSIFMTMCCQIRSGR